MMKKSMKIVILLLAGSLFLSSAAFADEPDSIIPFLQRYAVDRHQPFVGEVRFLGEPQLGEVCSLQVIMTALTAIDSTEYFRLNHDEEYLLRVIPDTLIWEPPIDSGETFREVITFVPQLVGNYNFTFGRKWKRWWHTLAQVSLAFDEDGRTLYAGSAKKGSFTNVPPHPRRNELPLTMTFPRRRPNEAVREDRHFTATFRFSNAPAVKEATTVEFELECHYDLYRAVQFIVDYSSNLKISALPESWGYRASSAEKYRHYKGSFTITPQQSGLYFMMFKVVGRHPLYRRLERITTQFPIYFVIGADNELQILCDFDPYTRFKRDDDSMLGSLTGLLENQNRTFRLAHARSKPDYIAEEQKASKNNSSQGD